MIKQIEKRKHQEAIDIPVTPPGDSEALSICHCSKNVTSTLVGLVTPNANDEDKVVDIIPAAWRNVDDARLTTGM